MLGRDAPRTPQRDATAGVALPGVRDLFGAEALGTRVCASPYADPVAVLPDPFPLPEAAPHMHASDTHGDHLSPTTLLPAAAVRRSPASIYGGHYSPRKTWHAADARASTSQSPRSTGTALPAILERLCMHDELVDDARSSGDMWRRKYRSWDVPVRDAVRGSAHSSSDGPADMLFRGGDRGGMPVYGGAGHGPFAAGDVPFPHHGYAAPATEPHALPSRALPSRSAVSMDASERGALVRSHSSYSLSAHSEGLPSTPGADGTEPPLSMDELGTARLSPRARLPAPLADIYQEKLEASGRLHGAMLLGRHSGHGAAATPASPPRSDAIRTQTEPLLPAHLSPGARGRSMGASTGKFECHWCSKRFLRPSSLRTHIHSHTGEKPYRCVMQMQV
ncbi:hypothetical protein MSPP1_000657 [Malassezia sp. CBS 17886]|nr:hypothetical protein MSPP1_000657 [Malassezia sp. CBS 17886]